MKITTIIDYQDGRDYIVVQERSLCNREIELNPRGVIRIGIEFCSDIFNYIASVEEWNRKSELEKLLLKTHDIAKGYRGKAPAGEMEKTWGVKKLTIKSNCVCVPVMQNK